MSVEDKCEVFHTDIYESSIALMKRKIRTKTDVEKDRKTLFRKIKFYKIISFLNPINYFKKEKPYF